MKCAYCDGVCDCDELRRAEPFGAVTCSARCSLALSYLLDGVGIDETRAEWTAWATDRKRFAEALKKAHEYDEAEAVLAGETMGLVPPEVERAARAEHPEHLVVKKRPHTREDQARAIYTLLVEHGGAPERWLNDFIRHFVDRREKSGSWSIDEFRFGGKLGSGGKFYEDYDRWWVACYPEDTTPERETLIGLVNTLLMTLRVGMGATDPTDFVMNGPGAEILPPGLTLEQAWADLDAALTTPFDGDDAP